MNYLLEQKCEHYFEVGVTLFHLGPICILEKRSTIKTDIKTTKKLNKLKIDQESNVKKKSKYFQKINDHTKTYLLRSTVKQLAELFFQLVQNSLVPLKTK